MYKTFIIILFLGLLPCTAHAQNTLADDLATARKLAEDQKYDDALTLLKKLQDNNPDNVELHLAIARTLSWSGNPDAAQIEIDKLSPVQKQNADAKLLQGYLYYYQKDFVKAEKEFSDILAHHPDYTDAATGLEHIRRASAAENAKDNGFKWQVDTGFEYSNFLRRSQDSWNQEFIQINRFFDNKKTVLHGTTRRYGQFTNVDSEYELGIDKVLSPRFTSYLYGTFSPHADFRPDWRIHAGGAARLDDPNDDGPALWVLVDMRRDVYEATDVFNFNPALRFEPVYGWGIIARAISVDQENEKRVYGQELRLNGVITDGWRFTAGFADAPETEAGVTVNTKTRYGNMAIDLGDAHTVRFGYTHDDRENSYIREVYNVSFSYKF